MNSYCIVLTNDLTDLMVENSLNESNTIRYNNDGTKAILKFSTPFPTVMQGYRKYSLSELLEILTEEEWNVPL